VSSVSCLYEGTVRHQRFAPSHGFSHRVAMAYIDLDELPNLLNGRLVRRAPGPIRFRRSDYHGDPARTLDSAVRDSVQRHTGNRPQGPVRVLTNLSCFGHCFNPVSFYYCFEPGGAGIDAVLAEVTNTPWGERHAYVIPDGIGRSNKALHVSPFLGMDHAYSICAEQPGQRLAISIENTQGDRRLFQASLALERRELTPASVRSLNWRYPFGSVRVLALIYARAVGLKLAGAHVFPHQRSTSA
jgi:DUF1365 family protein